jgi:general secretion pathway protein H
VRADAIAFPAASPPRATRRSSPAARSRWRSTLAATASSSAGEQGWQPVAEPALRERNWSRGRPPAAAGTRLGFDSVGLPDRALDLTLAGTNAKAVVEIAADGEVSIK